MVSVIIPTYNREKTIERAVRSVLSQTYSDLEVIVVDDCSVDNTQAVIESIDDSRLSFYRLKKNSGACVARNFGIEKAKGEYIAFQDSDDKWLSNKLEIQIEKMKENDASISFCQFQTMGEKNNRIYPNKEEGFMDRDEIIGISIASTQTIVCKRECLEDCVFDPLMPRLQDYDLCIRLSEKYRFYFVREPLVEMYRQDDSISQNFLKLLNAHERIALKYPELIEKNKSMRYAQFVGLAYAKYGCGMKFYKEKWMIFKIKPSLKTLFHWLTSLMGKFI